MGPGQGEQLLQLCKAGVSISPFWSEGVEEEIKAGVTVGGGGNTRPEAVVVGNVSVGVGSSH